MEKETLEEACKYGWYNTISLSSEHKEGFEEGFIQGAKWQQEKSYNNKEVLHLLDTLWDSLDIWYNEINSNKEFNLKDWFKNCELNKQKYNEQTI